MTNSRSTAATPATAPRINWIADLRGFLALYVVLHHAALNIDRSGTRDLAWWVVDAVFGWGHMRVDIFFVLSAFCLALPMFDLRRQRSFLSFMLRRCARLLPAYYVSVVISFALAAWLIGERSGTHWDVSVPVTAAGFWSHLLMVHQWWPQFALQANHPLWSIGAEFQLCLLLPLLVHACRRLGPWNSMAAATAVAYLAWRFTVAIDFPDPSPWGASVYYVCLFGLGVGGAYLYQAPGPLPLPGRMETALMACVATLMLGWVAAQEVRNHAVSIQIISFFVGIATVAVLVWSRAGSRSQWIVPGRIGQGLRFVGLRSYSLYLVHAPLLQLTWLYIVRPMHLQSAGLQALLMMIFGTLAALLGCWGLYEGVERWSGAWSHALGSGRAGFASLDPRLH